ncbi:MAG: hypothetical protein WA902_10980 [Thermosynechococcaceae cyanobacterium]
MTTTLSHGTNIDQRLEDCTSTATTLRTHRTGVFPNHPIARVYSVDSVAQMSTKDLGNQIRSYYLSLPLLASVGMLPLPQPDLITVKEQSEELSFDDIAVHNLPTLLAQRGKRCIHRQSSVKPEESLSNFRESLSEKLLSSTLKTQEFEIEENSDSQEIEPFWRDVFTLPSSTEIIFSKKIEVDIEELPPWEPHIEIDSYRLEDDDE